MINHPITISYHILDEMLEFINTNFAVHLSSTWPSSMQVMPFTIKASVLQVSKKFHELGREILYKKNSFHFWYSDAFRHTAKIFGSNAQLVANITVETMVPIPVLFFEQQALTRRLINSEGMATSFPNLKQVVVDFQRYHGAVNLNRSDELVRISKQEMEEALEEALEKELGGQCKVICKL